MIFEPVKEGYTLTQVALAIRFGCDASTIRRQTKLRALNGETVSGYVRGRHATWREHWKARRYHTGTLHGYEFVRREGDVERVTVVLWGQDKDTHMLKSVAGNLKELHSLTNKRIKDGSVSMLGVQALADNIAWLDDLIERVDRPAD
jgi:hypothetical protein